MARLTRLVLMLGCVFGVSTADPAKSQAGVIPWVYDAIFGPVGSLRSQAGYRPMSASYAPMYSGYGSYGYGAAYTSYAPMSVAYAPTIAAYAPTTAVSYDSYYASADYGYSAGYGSSGAGCACNQSSTYYPPTGYGVSYGNSTANYGTSGCSSCATGNCSNGAPTSMSSGYGPTPDPNYNSRNVNSRLDELEHQLRVLDHHQKEVEKFLKGHHKDDYSPNPYSSQTYSNDRNFNSGKTETVQPRYKNDSFTSDPDKYPAPRRRPTGPVDEEELRKPVLTPPKDDDRKSGGSSSKDAGGASGSGSSTNTGESEPQACRFDARITTRAVAPRERMQVVTNKTTTSIANSAKPTKKTLNTSENSRLTDIARQ